MFELFTNIKHIATNNKDTSNAANMVSLTPTHCSKHSLVCHACMLEGRIMTSPFCVWCVLYSHRT
jgi:hypothetical protein